MWFACNIQHLKVNSNIDANADQSIYDKWNTIDFQSVNRCPLFKVMVAMSRLGACQYSYNWESTRLPTIMYCWCSTNKLIGKALDWLRTIMYCPCSTNKCKMIHSQSLSGLTLKRCW